MNPVLEINDAAIDSLGAHLLGRIPSPPDERDFQLGDYLASSSPLDKALARLQSSYLVPGSVKAWAKLVTAQLDAPVPAPAPAPAPPVPPAPPKPAPTPEGDIIWVDADSVLDQGQTGHCVGFGGADWGNTLPVDDHYTNSDGHAIYYECKKEDGDPNAEDGSTVRSLAKVLKNRRRLNTYAFAASVEEIVAWLIGYGPVIVGTDWLDGMFSPHADGLVVPSGQVEGGHCYVAVGHLASEDAILFLNSWGAGWGAKGFFKMKTKDFAGLFAQGGEACAAVEIPALSWTPPAEAGKSKGIFRK